MKHANIIEKLNLEQKCALLSGDTVFTTRALPKAGIPSVTLSDGPNGVRKQAGAADHLGLNPSVPATCFPTAVTVACSWDPALGEEAGQSHGRGSCRAGSRRTAGAGPQHQAQPPLRPRLRVLLRGPLPCGQDGRRLCAGHPVQRHLRLPQAFCRQHARSCAAWRRTPCWTNAPCGRST